MTEVSQAYKDAYINMRIDNVRVKWCHLIKPDTEFNGNKWQMTLVLDDQPELVKELEAAGFPFTSKGDDKYQLKLKKEVETKTGTNERPGLFGPTGNAEFTEEVGDGSICNVKVCSKAWKIKGQWMITSYIEGVQVVKHVAKGGGGFDDVTGGEGGNQF